MKENKNLLGNTATDSLAETMEKPSRSKSNSKKRFETDPAVSYFLNDQDPKHTRRYSFDDNGGGYQGL
ncbi:MAG: hypothetical protein ACJ75B_02095 [Flavisolibacter sp.]